MHSLRVILTLLFAFAATSYAWPSLGFETLEARKNGNKTMHHGGNPTQKACKEMQKLEKVSSLGNNQTRLDELVAAKKLDASMVDAIKTKAAEATTKLQTMTSNTTLVGECAVIDAAMKTAGECRSMKMLSKLSMLAGNKTALDAMIAKEKLNGTQVDKLNQKIMKADTKFKAMSSNTTLTQICSAMKQQKGTSGNGSKNLLSDPKGHLILTIT